MRPSIPVFFFAFVLFAAFAAAGCGDPEANLVGVYNMTGTVTYSGGSPEDFTRSQAITESATPGKVVIDASSCSLTATVTSGTSFTVDQYTCPADAFTDPNCGNCNIVFTYTSGTGSLVGTTLNFNASGNYSLTCSVCSGSASGTFTVSSTGTRE
jgi:hypothetical protein